MSLDFFRQFVLNPFKTGAVAPSSRALAEIITPHTALEHATVVMELGPGTGVFTQRIVHKINARTLFFALEINPYFAKKTKERCPQVLIFNDSALHARKYLKGKQCDVIISGLPFAGFKNELQNDLLKVIGNSLNTKGIFLTFAYVHGTMLPSGRRFKQKLRTQFREVKTTKIIWKNFPPAIVYFCKK